MGISLAILLWTGPVSAFAAVANSCPIQDRDDRAEVEEISDGIYVSDHTDESLPEVTLVDGRSVHIGKKLSDQFGKAEIVSRRNDNQEFFLNLSQVSGIANPTDAPQLLIVAGGHAMFVSSWGSQQASDLVQLSTSIPDAQVASEVADVLDVPLTLRKHPGHQLLTTWTPTEKSFRPGQAVNLMLRIENVGDTTVRFYEGGQQRGYRDNQFRFIARASLSFDTTVPDTGDSRHMGGLAVLRELKPGDVFEKQIRLNEWFTFTKPDTYHVTAMYELDFHGEDRGYSIWHDFAVGECSIRIEPADASR